MIMLVMKLVILSLLFFFTAAQEFSENPRNYRRVLDDKNLEPRLNKDDEVYSSYMSNIVIEEYKLIFFSNPKAGSSTLHRILDHMLGRKNYLENHHIHHVHFKKVKDYSLKEAERMIKDPSWIKAIFIRDPKERLVSVYLDKIAIGEKYFKKKCCKNDRCVSTYKVDFKHFVKRMINECPNGHWDPQYERIDEKFWPYINFVGDFHNFSSEVERLLKLLGDDVWEKHGETGWGKDGTESFNTARKQGPLTNADESKRDFYKKSGLKRIVNERFAKDYELIKKHFGRSLKN